MSIENLTAYEIVEDREIRDLNSRGVILCHKKTGYCFPMMIPIKYFTLVSVHRRQTAQVWRISLNTVYSAVQRSIRSRIRLWNWQKVP